MPSLSFFILLNKLTELEHLIENVLVCSLKLLTGRCAFACGTALGKVRRNVDLLTYANTDTLEYTVMSIRNHRHYRTARTVCDNQIAVLKLMNIAVGSISSLGVDLEELTFFYKLSTLINKSHGSCLSVGLYRTEELHTKAENGIMECKLAGHGIKLSRENNEATENIVKHIVMVGYNKLAALMKIGCLFILPKSLALKEKQL